MYDDIATRSPFLWRIIFAHCWLSKQSYSLRFLPFLLLLVPFRVDLAREWIFELKRPKVNQEDLN